MRLGSGTTGLSPSLAPPSRGLGPSPPLRTLLQTTIRTTEPLDSKAGLFPIRSPLLRKSLVEFTTTTCCDIRRRGLALRPSACSVSTGVQIRSCAKPCSVRGATRCVTPWQTCPRPNGFGRNLRSKARWITV
ncbi:hypothetical protein R3W88_019018 [Solanum pinnatisectum]|uniref:Uncharacterized protein n=1 Tax=Solanum pinnatisectum TaxID=50273 RepID=A0AAV9KI26_9SOLN|nr:hypothetical protein R3W88_019018 [Solanum pinnatisectum]